MKPRRLIWASSALCLLIASCEKPKSTSAAATGAGNEKSDSLAAERAALEDERMALERQRLEDERAALEQEKAALEAEREARLADREDQADQRDITLEERQRALADRELDLRDREGELADREAGLSDRELEQAGRESLDDWEPEPVAEYEEPVADYGTFYDDLQPYGSWFETPDYGYVYQPTIVVQDTSWRPYTRGRWACTNRGWAWVSDEPFGWACFHYGRWTLINGRGWVWVPGDEWAPSWVCWREGGDCIGWAPLPPETLCYRRHGWNSSVEGEFGIGHGCFTFVHCRHMADPIWRHCLPIGENDIFIKQTTNITNIHIDHDRVVSGGPRFDKLRYLVNRPWPVYQLDTDRFQGLRDLAHRNSQLKGNRLTVFAPSMNTRWNAELKPQRVSAKWDDVKVVRAESGIKPEWTERFRETRQKQKEQAVEWKRDHSSAEDEKKQLQANREKVAEAQKTYQAKQREIVEARREKVMEKREQQQASRDKTLPGMAAGRKTAPEKADPGEAAASKPTLGERQRDLAERVRESRNRGKGDAQSDTSPTTPDRTVRPSNPPAAGIADNRRERQQQTSPQEQAVPGRNRERNDGAVAQDDSRRQQLEDARSQQQEQVRQRQEAARQAQENSRTQAEENTRRQGMEEARRQQQEAAREKAEQARQQQDERQRQVEENRQRQQEEASQRQEQSRRQAEENQRSQQQEQMQRQQQEQARQQQEERARQQQEERARQQEQARQQQEERAREQQERARQQEEQRARQQEEMQRRQEEARQQQEERARQQQEERARQQEQARQQQEERQRQQEQARQQQEESRRQQEESRRQQEESRRQEDERNRKQQEESQRQRGGR